MFDPTSRYADLEQADYERPDGTTVRYVRRRFVPDPATFEVLGRRSVTQGDRLDNMTADAFGDPELFWQLCDGNGVMEPAELEEIGSTLLITVPTADGGPR